MMVVRRMVSRGVVHFQIERDVTDHELTRPPAPSSFRGPLEVLLYVGQSCRLIPLPVSGSLRVGRGASNDIRIDDHSVSRFHLVLHVEGGRVDVEDLGSANGTLLLQSQPDGLLDEPTARGDGETTLIPGERRVVTPGNCIRAGAALLVVQPRRAQSSRPLASLSSRPPGDIGPAVLLDPEMKRVYEIAIRSAQSNLSVLITGETGAGKEIFAETIHARSNRRSRPFLRLNCAALSESLLETELFGHERGAFTGANQAKAGLLESTDQGTVFLDEIGEMPLSTQAKLLRVLEEKSILRVGATRPRPIDVRFIWATNRDLRAEAKLGRFRQDLYFRISGVEFTIPPLRKRPSEIEPLARLFLERFCSRTGIPVPALTEGAVQALLRYSWPGNVRELRNTMERAPFMCGSGPITAEHVPEDRDPETGLFPAEDFERTEVLASSAPVARQSVPDLDGSATDSLSVTSLTRSSGRFDVDRAQIARALEQCAGNQTRAAELLGVSRRTLINHIERLNIPRPKKR